MRAAAALVACACALAPQLARAQDGAAVDAERDTARAEFAAGESAFAAHDYQVALGHFQAAFRAVPRDAVRFNVAVCFERLARFREALDEYDLASRSPELDDAGRARAAEQAARIRPWLATLVVGGERAGAHVSVEGEELCTVPCRASVDPRRLVVTVRDASGEETRVVVPERGATVELDFARPAPAPHVVARSAPAVRATPHGGSVSALTAIGAVLVGLGAGGTIGFGLRTQDLHDAFGRTPTTALANDGELFRALTNASIVAMGVGAVLVAIDVLFVSGFFSSHEPADARAVAWGDATLRL